MSRPATSDSPSASNHGSGSGSGSGSRGYYPSPPPFPFSFHLLEVTVISAQNLHSIGRSMQTYAVAWVDLEHKVKTRLDGAGHTDPSWNEKFVFRVEDSVLRSDTAVINVEIYARRLGFLSDKLLGTSRALMSTIRPALVTQYYAFQVRRPDSLRPQGMLNMSVSLLDGYAKSLPIYQDLNRSYKLKQKVRIDSSKDKDRQNMIKIERKPSYKRKRSTKGFLCFNPVTESGEVKPVAAQPWIVKRRGSGSGK